MDFEYDPDKSALNQDTASPSSMPKHCGMIPIVSRCQHGRMMNRDGSSLAVSARIATQR